jgi:ComF family protein
MRPLLHLLKYSGMEPIAAQLGGAIAARLAQQPDLPSAMTVVPVPLFRAREKQRGFNQSELLARAVVRAMRTIHPEWRGELAARALERRRATQSQAGLSLSERRRNLRGAFFVSTADIIRGRHLLLVDDIFTTGATARACSSVLKRAGAASVWVATAARAQRYDAIQQNQFQNAHHEFHSPAAEPLPNELGMATDVARWDSTVH